MVFPPSMTNKNDCKTNFHVICFRIEFRIRKIEHTNAILFWHWQLKIYIERKWYITFGKRNTRFQRFHAIQSRTHSSLYIFKMYSFNFIITTFRLATTDILYSQPFFTFSMINMHRFYLKTENHYDFIYNSWHWIENEFISSKYTSREWQR